MLYIRNGNATEYAIKLFAVFTVSKALNWPLSNNNLITSCEKKARNISDVKPIMLKARIALLLLSLKILKFLLLKVSAKSGRETIAIATPNSPKGNCTSLSER